jgi:hypothetical protein
MAAIADSARMRRFPNIFLPVLWTIRLDAVHKLLRPEAVMTIPSACRLEWGNAA